MAQFTVRNLEEDVKRRLKLRAEQHGLSMEEEVRRILRRAVCEEPAAPVRLGSRMAARFAQVGLKQALPEWRGQPVRAADFEP